jgi:hypothetical protein
MDLSLVVFGCTYLGTMLGMGLIRLQASLAT